MKHWLAISIVIAACGHGGEAPQDAAPGTAGDARAASDARASDAAGDAGVDAPPDAPPPRFLCDEEPPPGAPMPVPPPPAMACPTLAAGTNTITSSGGDRQFELVLPADPQPGEHYPVLFMWYWLGGSADSFIDKGQIQAAADDQRFIAVVPVDAGADVLGTSFDTRWPFDITQSGARMTQEFQFFDDMLSCVEQQFDVNQSCVSTIGVSAGALFTDQLVQARSERLASFVSLSGGVGATIVKPWTGATHKLPGIVLWGGDGPPAQDGVRDILGCFGIGMDFSVASSDLEDGLTADGHFFIECKHNCGHVEPPFDPPPGETKYAGIWEFALNHPFWLAPGASPYAGGLPPSLPAWCGIGADSATPRTGGGCPMAENPCAY